MFSSGLRHLRWLNLRENGITEVGALTLADSPLLLVGTRLDLRENPIHERVKNAIQIRLGERVKV